MNSDSKMPAPDEWHLRNNGQSGGRPGADCNAPAAWALTRGEPDITIAVIDDGFQLAHPGIAEPGKVLEAYDAANDAVNPKPNKIIGWHGTASAVLCVGSGDQDTALGLAPKCRLLPIRIDGRVGDPQEARAFDHARRAGADVICCAWGALDGISKQPFAVPKKTDDAIHRCTSEGRKGLGIPVIFAAGNGNEPVDLDGYANHPDVICVAAITNEDEPAHYSDYGLNVSVCGPSSGGTLDVPMPGIPTGQFGSTSAAAAMAAGIAALMLSVNPRMTALDVKTTLQKSARKVNRDRAPHNFVDYWGKAYSDAYDDRRHSLTYGYGCIDAGKAVALVAHSSATLR